MLALNYCPCYENDPEFKSSRVVALTAGVMGEQVVRLKREGFDGTIVKSLDISVFPDLIAKILKLIVFSFPDLPGL